MNTAVMPLAECEPLLIAPDIMPPWLETMRASNSCWLEARITFCSSASGIVASAITRLPRVLRLLIWEAFLSVAMFASRKKRSTSPG